MLIDPFWLSLAGKMASTAVLVVGAAAAVERTGPVIGAMIATLPVMAGPAYIFLAMEHGAGFIAGSSLASLSAIAGTAAFMCVYVTLAQRHGVIVSLGLALLLWVGVTGLITGLDLSWPGAFALNVVAYGAALLYCRRFLDARATGIATSRPWDLPVRAVAVMLSVAAVVFAGRLLGPAVAGMTAMAPVVFTCLVVLLHPRLGGPPTAAVIAHALPGMSGFAVALTVLHLAVMPLGSTLALSLALAVCVGWNAAFLFVRRRG